MTSPCAAPLPLYRPRDPQASHLWRLLDRHFLTFQQVYDEQFEADPEYRVPRASSPPAPGVASWPKFAVCWAVRMFSRA